MAASIKLISEGKMSGMTFRVFDATLDSSCPSNGYAIGKGSIGMNVLGAIVLGSGVSGGNAGYTFDFDIYNSKLRVFWTGASTSAVLAEAVGANLASITPRILFIGI